MTMSEQQNVNNILVDISNPLDIKNKVFNTDLLQDSIINKKVSDFYNIITKSIIGLTKTSINKESFLLLGDDHISESSILRAKSNHISTGINQNNRKPTNIDYEYQTIKLDVSKIIDKSYKPLYDLKLVCDQIRQNGAKLILELVIKPSEKDLGNFGENNDVDKIMLVNIVENLHNFSINPDIWIIGDNTDSDFISTASAMIHLDDRKNSILIRNSSAYNKNLNKPKIYGNSYGINGVVISDYNYELVLKDYINEKISEKDFSNSISMDILNTYNNLENSNKIYELL
ncbi:MAG: hypothetical protein CL774_04560 [Chloroflexi bacterium]|nr:hypothetical protein [Chloroflexota bacterium]